MQSLNTYDAICFMRRTVIFSVSCLLLLAPYSIYILSLIQVPPYARDELTHHLALPKLWTQDGLLHEYPDILFSYYPQLIDLLYYLPTLAGYDLGARYIHWAFALLTALLVFQYLSNKLNKLWGLAGVILLLSIPVVLRLSTLAYVDLGLMFFATICLLNLCKWLTTGSRISLTIAAIGGGLMLSCKYSALTAYISILLIMPLCYAGRYRTTINTQWPKFASDLILFIIISTLFFSPWLIRNIILTDNPIYPLYHSSITKSADTDITSGADSIVKAFTISGLTRESDFPGVFRYRYLVYEESMLDIISMPVRIFFQGRDDNLQYFDGTLHPSLILLPALLLILAHRLPENIRRDCRLLSSFSILLIIMTVLTVDMRIRYIIAVVPALTILAVYALRSVQVWAMSMTIKPIANTLLPASLLCLHLLYSGAYAWDYFNRTDPLPYLLGIIDENQFVSAKNPEHMAVLTTNQILTEQDRVLGVFLGERRYYFDADPIVNNDVFFEALKSSTSANQLRNHLSSMSLTHILINLNLFQNWLAIQPHEEVQIVSSFLEMYCIPLKESSGYLLFRIQ